MLCSVARDVWEAVPYEMRRVFAALRYAHTRRARIPIRADGCSGFNVTPMAALRLYSRHCEERLRDEAIQPPPGFIRRGTLPVLRYANIRSERISARNGYPIRTDDCTFIDKSRMRQV